MVETAAERLQVRVFQVGELSLFHRNPRRGDVRAIAESLKAHGQYRPLVVNVGTATGRPLEILAGNHTYLAACSLGWDSVQATTVDVDDETAHRIVLADNRLADLGAYDDADLVAALEAAGDLAGTGYERGDLDALLAELSEPVSLTDPDDVPALPDGPTVSRLGDVWELGPHRLLVGSSGDLDAVRAAMPEGVAWDCVWTDPPYGVEYVGGTGLTIQNDGEADAIAVSVAFLEVAAEMCRPGAPLYLAHADVLRIPLQTAMAALGIRWRQTLMWVKDRFVLSRADYHYQSEPIALGEVDGLTREYDPIAYGFLPGGEGRLGRGGKHWHGDNRSSTVFDVKRPSRSSEHPTMKPVELIEAMLTNSCAPGAWVADGFAGSGSTLIAAHRLARKAFLVELDPRYADVICRRWHEHSGIAPVRDGVAHDFAEVAGG